MNILIIGYGSIGKRHAQILKGLNMQYQISLVTSQESDEFDCHPHLNAITDLNLFEYFIIANETALHQSTLEYLDAAVQNKIILVEKPLFSDYSDFVSQSNHIYVAYNLRFHPIFKKIRTLIQTQHILSINIVTGQYLPTWRPGRDYRESYSAFKERGGGVLLDLSHELDYLQWLCGPLKKSASINATISDLQIDSDDIMTLVGRTEKNVVCTLTIDYISKIPHRHIIIHTNELTLFADLISNTITFGGKEGAKKEIRLGTQERNATYEAMHLNILHEPLKHACSLQEGLALMRTIATIKNSTLDH